MKKLNFVELEAVSGGLKFTSLSGVFCGAALVLACSGVLAPLAAAPAVGCAATLAANAYWKSQGINVE